VATLKLREHGTVLLVLKEFMEIVPPEEEPKQPYREIHKFMNLEGRKPLT